MLNRYGIVLTTLLNFTPFGAIAQDTKALAPQPVAGETASAPAGPLWLMSCSNQANVRELLCEFSQSLVVTQGEQSQRVATAAFTRKAGSTKLNAAFVFPYGVSLPKGVKVSVNGAEISTLTWQSCDLGGCYATGEVGQPWIDAMRRGSEMSTTLSNIAGRELNFKFQLSGFSETLNMLP